MVGFNYCKVLNLKKDINALFAIKRSVLLFLFLHMFAIIFHFLPLSIILSQTLIKVLLHFC